MKVLVTGGAGFIGSFLTRALLWRGNDVVAIDNFHDYYPRSCKEFNVDLCRIACNQEPLTYGVDELNTVCEKLFSYYPESTGATCGSYLFEECDVRDSAKLALLFSEHKFDAVIHLAAMAGVPASAKNPTLYVDVNVMGTAHLLDLCVKHEISRFVFGSSSSVYGHRGEGLAKEDDTLCAASVYGVSKAAGEELCRVFSSTYGLKVGVARIFGPIFGPLQRPFGMLAQRAINYAYHGKTLQVYGRDGLLTAKDSTYIDDEVAGLLLCLDHTNSVFEIFNIGTSDPITIERLLKAVSHEMGKKLAHAVAPVDTTDVTSSADISKAARLLGYAPKISFEEGISRQVEIFKLMPDWYKQMDV